MMNISKTFKVKNINDLEKVVDYVLSNFPDISLIFLEGDLGVGKTTFVQKFVLRKFLIKDVTSPTFSILNIYEQNSTKIFHYDLYRIMSSEELVELSIVENLQSGVTLIEWPEISFNLLSRFRKLVIKFHIKEGMREIIVNLIN